MRALKNLVLALAAGLLLTGCTKEYIMQGTEMTFLDYDVNRWDYYEAGNYDDEGYYGATLDVPDITRDVVKYGNVQVSCYDQGKWSPLPMMRVNSDILDDGSEIIYTTYTDFDWSDGTVTVYVTASDLYGGVRPGAMSFRVYITR
jgi:hypothetical protein